MPLADFKTGTKQCSRCGEIKLISDFSRLKKSTDGLRCECRACHIAETSEWRRKNSERRNERERQHRLKNGDAIREREVQYRAINKESINSYRRKWYLRNRERLRRKAAKRRNDNREQINQYHREWAENNRPRSREIKAKYQKANPERERAKQHRRRARLAESGGSYTIEDVQQQLAGQKHRCWWCRKKLGDDYHIEHCLPISRGGRNDPTNIVISCPHCNWSKGNKTPQEFAGTFF